MWCGDLKLLRFPFRVLLQYSWFWCVVSFTHYLFSPSSHCFSSLSFYLSIALLYCSLYIVVSLFHTKLFGLNLLSIYLFICFSLLLIHRTTFSFSFYRTILLHITAVYFPGTIIHTLSTSNWKIHIIFKNYWSVWRNILTPYLVFFILFKYCHYFLFVFIFSLNLLLNWWKSSCKRWDLIISFQIKLYL